MLIHFAQDLYEFALLCDSLKKENILYSILSLLKHDCVLFLWCYFVETVIFMVSSG